jgi:signal transduction histidine kinase/Tfp pilus assembly protein PilF
MFRFTPKHKDAYGGCCILTLCLNTICSLLIFITASLTAQTTSQDSLLNVVKTLPDDTNKVNTIQLIAANYLKLSRDYKKMSEYAWKGLALSQQLHYEKGVANAYSCIGIWYAYKGNKEMALYHYQKALRLMQKRNDKKGEGNIYNNIARVMLASGNYVEALSNNLKCLKIKEALHDKEGMALSYLNIGNVFSVQNKLDVALGYYIKSIQLSEGMANTNSINAYNNIGNIFAEKKKYTDALTYHLKALHICEKLNDKMGMVASYNNIGSDHFHQQQLEAALLYHVKAYNLAIEAGNKSGQAFACNGIGNVNQSKRKYAEALAYYTKMLKLGTELNNQRIIQLAYENFVSLYKETGNFQQALTYTGLVNNMKDSLLGLESQKQLSELITKYETQKKAKEILLLTKERQLNMQQIKQQTFVRWVLTIGLVILLLSIIGVYKRYLFKQKANMELMKTQNELYKVIEQKEKLTSILAHDLKTPLRFMMTVSAYLDNSIQALNLEELGRLSNELSTSARNTYAFADELLTWLSIQRQSFTVQYSEVNLHTLMNELLEFFKDIAKTQHTELKMNLPLFVAVETDIRLLKIILRNILDNAIKNTNPGEVVISISKQNEEMIEIHIRDTGNGMTKEQLEQLDVENTYGFPFEIKSKLGFQIIKDLSTLLHIKLEIESEIGTGTTIILQLPLEKKKMD